MSYLKEAAATQLELTAHVGPVLFDSPVFCRKLEIQVPDLKMSLYFYNIGN